MFYPLKLGGKTCRALHGRSLLLSHKRGLRREYLFRFIIRSQVLIGGRFKEGALHFEVLILGRLQLERDPKPGNQHKAKPKRGEKGFIFPRRQPGHKFFDHVRYLVGLSLAGSMPAVGAAAYLHHRLHSMSNAAKAAGNG